MKVLVVGATGTIGRAVVQELSARHEVLEAAQNSGKYRVDVASAESIKSLFEQVGKVDAIVSTTGKAHFGPLADMTIDQFKIGLHHKLLGQVQLALIGQAYLNDRGSITLTSGILSYDPVVAGANASVANAAIDGFVRAAAIELPRGIRINSVSPSVLVESLPSYGPFFRGFEAVPAKRVALAYSKSVEGAQSGQVYEV
ncbi:MAG TPA: short chain dehydrogenase, partial [Steroidobacteraceae bacterium]|nr:short chain dehydrogenase [Steroidobacteraceae bacterium]